jgi:Mn2+/Fe2+ NRAMP family transporter
MESELGVLRKNSDGNKGTLNKIRQLFKFLGPGYLVMLSLLSI